MTIVRVQTVEKQLGLQMSEIFTSKLYFNESVARLADTVLCMVKCISIGVSYCNHQSIVGGGNIKYWGGNHPLSPCVAAPASSEFELVLKGATIALASAMTYIWQM